MTYFSMTLSVGFKLKIYCDLLSEVTVNSTTENSPEHMPDRDMESVSTDMLGSHTRTVHRSVNTDLHTKP